MAAGKPPTTNVLPEHERRRMMHSVRKLGAIMGTTPILVDEPELPSMEIVLPTLTRRSSKRDGVVFTPSFYSTTDVDDDLKLEPSVPKLVLSPDAHNSINDATRLRLVLTLTQFSPSLSESSCSDPASVDALKRSLSVLVSTPPPSSSTHAHAHAARRKKMMKLVKILGGPVPLPLVFPPAPPEPSRGRGRADFHAQSHTRGSRRRSRSAPPPSAYAFSTAPRKLVRAAPAPVDPGLPALTVDIISRPHPLAPYTPMAMPGPVSRATGENGGHRVSRRKSGLQLGSGSHRTSGSSSAGRSYSLRRRVREYAEFTSESFR
ncbi:hypothetical protein GGX14DRAFT_426931 [Mycena pura]|uniref:Uncharacterized protein n=1 Tax=Mycena pura TaxID=153505 RepID=A0AAD6YLM7_9AGAR|nr:hypothetical protein GGX14DRAFT_426931 [Mycena pura]